MTGVGSINKTSILLFLLVSTLFMASWSDTSGIIMRHDRADSEYLQLGTRYKAVGSVGGMGEGTLIAPDWVLTAAHVAEHVQTSHRVIFGKDAYHVREVFLYPRGRGLEDDIALIRLKRPVTNVAPASLYPHRDEQGKMVVFVGRGTTGNGKNGPQEEDGVVRAATNQVAAVRENDLVFEFNSGSEATNLEGISGPGDSGGPAFIEKDGVVYIAGVSSRQDLNEKGGEGLYGVLEIYARVSSYGEWLEMKMKSEKSVKK